MPARPFRATVYLPGHLGDGSMDGLTAALVYWEDQGYRRVAYEVLELPLTDSPEQESNP